MISAAKTEAGVVGGHSSVQRSGRLPGHRSPNPWSLTFRHASRIIIISPAAVRIFIAVPNFPPASDVASPPHRPRRLRGSTKLGRRKMFKSRGRKMWIWRRRGSFRFSPSRSGEKRDRGSKNSSITDLIEDEREGGTEGEGIPTASFANFFPSPPLPPPPPLFRNRECLDPVKKSAKGSDDS